MNGISPIEMNGMVTRTQDFNIMKHHEDAKPQLDQNNIQTRVEEKVQESSSTVKEGQQTENSGENRGNGSGYAGDGGRYRKKKDEVPDKGRVIKKSQSRFEISI